MENGHRMSNFRDSAILCRAGKCREILDFSLEKHSFFATKYAKISLRSQRKGWLRWLFVRLFRGKNGR